MKKFAIIFVFIILISTNIFSSSCITPITDIFNGEIACIDGYQTSNERWCSFTIDPDISDNNSVVIEVISGGRYDSDRDMYQNYSTSGTLNIWLDRETKPVYINCYDSVKVQATDGSSGWQKENILQQLSLAIDPINYDTNNPEDLIADSIRNLPDSFDGFTIENTYTNLSIDDNDGVKWISLI